MKSNRYLVLALIMAAIVVVSGCTMLGQTTGNQTSMDSTVQDGDAIRVSYEGRLVSGEIFDSGEIEFQVGDGSMIEGFDEAVVGMALNEEKEVTIPPEKAYGEYNPSLIQTVQLTQEINKTDEAPLTAEDFEDAVGEAPVAGNEFDTPWAPWKLKVLEVLDDSIILEHMPEEGQTISMGYGTGTVSIEGDKVIITTEPDIGETIQTAYGPAKILEGESEDEVSIDFNHELVDKTLVFSIKVLEIEKPEKYDKPVLDLFIMSYCPYGLQMQKAVLPVMELLGDKAEINIKWVSYAMHEKKEIDENTRQYCIQLEQADKYIAYAKCFTASGDADSCLVEAGIDTSALNSCMAEADGEFKITELYENKSAWTGSTCPDSPYCFPLYMVDAEENELYGVGGSPTVVLNGKVTSITRSPEAVKQEICNAFETMPQECSQTLSSTQASSGFGADAGTGSSGTCG